MNSPLHECAVGVSVSAFVPMAEAAKPSVYASTYPLLSRSYAGGFGTAALTTKISAAKKVSADADGSKITAPLGIDAIQKLISLALP
jgi:hypothetical protein